MSLLKLDFKPLKSFPKQFSREFHSGMKEGFVKAVTWLTVYSRFHHPTFKNRTLKLAQSLKVHINTNKTSGNINSNLAYSRYLYDGTKSHFIEPTKKKALSWSKGGQRFFSKGHMVKGIKKSEWILRNYNNRSTKVNSFIVNGITGRFR